MSSSTISTVRFGAGVVIVGAGLATQVAAAPNATLTITETNRSASATGGPFFVPNQTYTAAFVLADPNGDAFVCDDIANPCLVVQLEVNLPADYATQHPTDSIRITANWDPQVSDLDMHVYRPPYDTASGNWYKQSRGNPPTPEVVEFPAPSGNNSYRVYLVPAAPAALSATIRVSLQTGPAPRPSGTVTLGGPDFANYVPPPGVTNRGDSVSEPTMGTNIGTNKAYMLFTFDVMEASFDDATMPPTASWRNLGTGGAPATADPFFTMDQHRFPDGTVNDRVWIGQLLAASSYIAYNSSSGTSSTWTRSVSGPGQVHGVDNESIAVGPYPNNQKPTTARPDATYPHAMYYCSHDAANAFCSRSDDGGATFNPSRPIFGLLDQCGNHGHVKVGADGTVYVPMNNTCQGHQGVSISIDAGETWYYLQVPNTTNGRWDSSIGIANDGKTVYYGYAEQGDDRPMIIKGTLDKSDSSAPFIQWDVPATDVGAPAGLQNIVFSSVVVGDPDRAAFAFHGTATAGNSGAMSSFPPDAEWNLWVATTFDGGINWQLRNATPHDPTQKGSICDQGTLCDNAPDDRNLLDFMDMDIDGEGRILVGYADGCVDTCVAGAPNSFTARGTIARQSAGRRMYAAFDPQPIDAPGSPLLRGIRSPGSVDLSWSAPDPGSAPVTSYRIERATNGGAFRDLASTLAMAMKYEDATAIDVAATYRYRVSAVNLHGAGAPSNTVAPTLPNQSVCGTPGLTISTDAAGDVVATVSGNSVPAPPVTDLVLLTVGEPYLAGGALDLVFQLKTAGLSEPLPPNLVWFVSFLNPSNVAYAVRMATDTLGNPRFESYRVAAENGAYRGDFVSGTPRPALPNSGYSPSTGLITIVIPAADVGVAAGQRIRGLLAACSKPGVPSPGPGLPGVLSQALDLMPDNGAGVGVVITQPVASCGPNAAPVAVLNATTIGPRRNLRVSLDASRSFDPDAGASDPQLRDSVVGYVFDFGDGTPPFATANPVVEHQYPQGGIFAARLRVQDSRGKWSSTEAVKQICEKCLKQR
jgi:hypothetical protein